MTVPDGPRGTRGPPVSGVVLVLAATVFAGVAGYAVQLTASARIDDPVTYVAFGTFWSAMYAVVSLLAGVQNEVTRAVRPAPGHEPAGRALDLLALAGVAASVLVLACGATALAAPRLAPAALWMAVAGLGYLAVTILGGIVQGLGRWGSVASLNGVDAVVRMVLVVPAVLLAVSPGWLFAAMALPFALTVLLVGSVVGPSLRGSFVVDVRRGVLMRQAAGAVLASAALGLMISGMPALMSALARGESAQRLAELLMVTGLARAPLIVPLLAMQGLLLVRFRDGGGRWQQELRRTVAAVAAATVLATVAAAALGPSLLDVLTSGQYAIEAWFVGGIVAGAGLLGIEVVVGAAFLARSNHRSFASMWTTSAAVSVLVLLGPGPLDLRSLVAMVAGPAVGIVLALGIPRLRDPAGAAR